MERFGLEDYAARRLSGLYGAEASAVAGPGPERLCAELPMLKGEVDWAVQVEGAHTVQDVLYRRTGAAFVEPEATRTVPGVAAQLASLYG